MASSAQEVQGKGEVAQSSSAVLVLIVHSNMQFFSAVLSLD